MKSDDRISRKGGKILNIKVQTSLCFMGTGGACLWAGEKEVKEQRAGFCRPVKVVVYLPSIYLSLLLMRRLQV